VASGSGARELTNAVRNAFQVRVSSVTGVEGMGCDADDICACRRLHPHEAVFDLDSEGKRKGSGRAGDDAEPVLLPSRHAHARDVAVEAWDVALEVDDLVFRQITFVDVPPDAFRNSLEGVLPEWQLDGLLEDYEHYVRGKAAAVRPTVTEITGQEPRDIARFAREYATRFTSQA
jgi:hypothetical protein